MEFLGALGVIGSLVFVGLEVRQNSKAARAAASTDLGQGWIEWNIATATREIQEALLVVAESTDPSQAPPVDRAIAEAYARSLFSNWATSHYQHVVGVLDPALWEGVTRDMGGSVDPGGSFGRLIQWAWPRNRHLYHSGFVVLMDSLTASAKHGAGTSPQAAPTGQ